jgi:ABC-type antimicrobial peptide transport system permease subunit
MIPVLSGYFRAMGAQILYGREFTDAEVRSGARVAVVNGPFAAGFGIPQNVIGHQLTMDEDSWRIVGVVKGMEYETDPTIAGGNQVFIPSTTPGSFFSTFVVRVDGQAKDYVALVRDTIQSVDPQVPVYGAKTMEQRLDEFFVRPRFFRTAIWLFTGFTMLLAVIGIYGIVAYTIVQRNHEMGVRMALGKTSLQLRGTLLRQGLLTVVIGALVGIAAAQLTGRFLEALTNGAKTVGLALSTCLLLFVAAVASASLWSATRRIATLDIISILRSE